jgi:hypothetical protein
VGTRTSLPARNPPASRLTGEALPSQQPDVRACPCRPGVCSGFNGRIAPCRSARVTEPPCWGHSAARSGPLLSVQYALGAPLLPAAYRCRLRCCWRLCRGLQCHHESAAQPDNPILIYIYTSQLSEPVLVDLGKPLGGSRVVRICDNSFLRSTCLYPTR